MTQRTLCDLLHSSLELLSAQTSADVGFGELEHQGSILKMKSSSTGNSHSSAGRRLNTLDTASAQLVSRKLKQLTSMFCVFEYYCTVHIDVHAVCQCELKILLMV